MKDWFLCLAWFVLFFGSISAIVWTGDYIETKIAIMKHQNNIPKPENPTCGVCQNETK